MNALAARRRHPAAIAILLLLGLVAVGGAYSLLAPRQADASVVAAGDLSKGKALFLANCATCHGMNAQGSSAGPTLVGVGAASVDFQVGTGRMPLAGPNVQAQRNDNVKFSQEEIQDMAAYVASLAPGPAVPNSEYTEGQNADVARGGELFRVNCAMCHNYAGSGGALTRGKYAPSLKGVEGKYIYEAMVTGPQSMPVFNDANISPENKNDIIAYLQATQEEQKVGGMDLGNLGPVSEGLFIWVFGLGIMLGCAFWLGQKAA
ncbi:c-type cytochrome [Lapillicoccus jejuensis]|uniref:Cytochrome bc1 complex cytochrome c subunit n=1 Tax=Lapillicoccus jejuensis TaxID=402171 RepID=A0A542E5P1_9MICO|nr:cytochrome c [Lapillicoccus jejuensis]TQJ10653.1 menaquinol-cytochrome c reductase cytochrome c1 subunit precursor [Lapillicoccus jejuensis]